MNKIVWMSWLLLTIVAEAQQTRLQRLAILETSQTTISNRRISPIRSFASICIDYDREAPNDTVAYSYVVANGERVPVTIRYTNGQTRSSNLASVINNRLIEFSTIRKDSYKKLYATVSNRNVQSITINQIRTPVIVSASEGDTQNMNFNLIFRSFPDIFGRGNTTQAEYWWKSFSIDVLKDNHRLDMTADSILNPTSMHLIDKISKSTLIRKVKIETLKKIRLFVILDGNGNITKGSLNKVLWTLINKSFNWENIKHYWRINTIQNADSSETLALQELPSWHTGGRGSGGGPPYIFDVLYNGFQKFLEIDDCEVKICLETQPGDTLNLKLTFEISCQNPNDGTTESASFSVEYNTSDGFSISSDAELSNEIGVEGIEFVISPKNLHTESCQLEITGKFCIPDGPEITLDYCGTRKTVKPNKFRFNF